MKKNDSNYIVIDENFGQILISSVRYALGRRTYIVDDTIEYITPLISKLSNHTLAIFDQDIADQKYYGGYGDTCDEVRWLKFHEDIRTERTKRGEKLYRSFREPIEYVCGATGLPCIKCNCGGCCGNRKEKNDY